MATEPTIPAAIVEKAARGIYTSERTSAQWVNISEGDREYFAGMAHAALAAVYADIQAEAVQGNSGRIVTAEFSDGINYPLVGCEECDCQLHDDPPKPAGIYATIRFDDDSTRIGISRRVVMVELGGGVK